MIGYNEEWSSADMLWSKCMRQHLYDADEAEESHLSVSWFEPEVNRTSVVP